MGFLCAAEGPAENIEEGWVVTDGVAEEKHDEEGNYEGYMRCSKGGSENKLEKKWLCGKAVAVVIAHTGTKTQDIYMNVYAPPESVSISLYSDQYDQYKALAAWWMTMKDHEIQKKELFIIMPGHCRDSTKQDDWRAKMDWRISGWAQVLGNVVGVKAPVIIPFSLRENGIPGIDHIVIKSLSTHTSVQCYQSKDGSSKMVCEYTSDF